MCVCCASSRWVLRRDSHTTHRPQPPRKRKRKSATRSRAVTRPQMQPATHSRSSNSSPMSPAWRSSRTPACPPRAAPTHPRRHYPRRPAAMLANQRHPSAPQLAHRRARQSPPPSVRSSLHPRGPKYFTRPRPPEASRPPDACVARPTPLARRRQHPRRPPRVAVAARGRSARPAPATDTTTDKTSITQPTPNDPLSMVRATTSDTISHESSEL